jgi:hypothetical protein
LGICTLYKGKPYGPASIKYESQNKFEKFEGIGVFTDGDLHLGPFTCLRGDSVGCSFSMMINGQPADQEYATIFNKQGYVMKKVKSLSIESDVGGLQ